MQAKPTLLFLSKLPLLCVLLCCASAEGKPAKLAPPGSETNQVPAWTKADLEFFLHGSMSTEVVPETMLKAFIQAFPDLFPSGDLSHLGLIPDTNFGWPVGFSRSRVAHLGGLPSLGVNCAACHLGEVTDGPGTAPLRVLGMTSHFDSEAYFGAVAVATFRCADPENMKRYLGAWMALTEPTGGDAAQELLLTEWQKQAEKIAATIAADPGGTNGAAPGAFQPIMGAQLRLDHKRLLKYMDLAALAHNHLKLFHNVRASLDIPDQPPGQLPPASGPGRNDAFGVLSAILLGIPQPYAPVKYGLVWNLDHRHWVHWDGNTQSPIGRNLLAALGLGAPLHGHQAELDFALIKRQTDLGELIHPPHYPFAIDKETAQRGAAQYQAQCASCHDGVENDTRLHAPDEVGTDPRRALSFTQDQADHFDKFLAELITPGYQPAKEPGLRGTQKYWAASLGGVWARSPYLHNGSVRTMRELLSPPAARAQTFHRGTRVYDPIEMGYLNDGAYVLDTTTPGNSNSGHDYGTTLSDDQKRDLIEYLKTL